MLEMPFSSRRALLFKEGRTARFALLTAIVAFSLGPLQSLLMILADSRNLLKTPNMVQMNVLGIDLPGLGFLIIGFSIGYALFLLRDVVRRGGQSLAFEPLSMSLILSTKFWSGTVTIAMAQTVTTIWVWAALAVNHVAGPLSVWWGWWLTCVVFELSFYAITFGFVLVVRPVPLALLLTAVLAITPHALAQVYMNSWHRDLPNIGYVIDMPSWAAGVFNTIQDFSPYGIIHFGVNDFANRVGLYIIHTLEPMVWFGLAVCTVLWVGKTRASLSEFSAYSKNAWLQSPRAQVALRLFSTLCAALIAQQYAVHTEILRLWSKLLVILFLWLICDLLVRGLIHQTVRDGGAARTFVNTPSRGRSRG